MKGIKKGCDIRWSIKTIQIAKNKLSVETETVIFPRKKEFPLRILSKTGMEIILRFNFLVMSLAENMSNVSTAEDMMLIVLIYDCSDSLFCEIAV